ncbi:unnamed protein product [Prunus armeniaca]|uniref:Uncharacterized protein n=1 Tax=Prunus armeniaca TaxID=36596 RepID=A0A6J5W2I1_PRUAR|nr:unnamed protein product [Prunus armeniaca]
MQEYEVGPATVEPGTSVELNNVRLGQQAQSLRSKNSVKCIANKLLASSWIQFLREELYLSHQGKVRKLWKI